MHGGTLMGAKEALAYAKKKESDTANEEQEAIDAEAQAEKEQQGADQECTVKRQCTPVHDFIVSYRNVYVY